MKKLIIAGCVAATLITTGCTGSFVLTKKVWEVQTQFEEKWVDEVAFLGCVILPVYGISVLADAIILNSVEFWSGEKVNLAEAGDGTYKVERDGQVCLLEKSGNQVTARDADGKLLYTSTADENNTVTVRNAQGEIVKVAEHS